ncbi:phosphoserine phosphatase [uncultured archaeon]|nr:phosphoserine phosphatase [uncultured archaeon]
MSDLLQEFEQKREVIRKIVEEHVRKRDEASQFSHEQAEERDTLNAKVREMRDEAKKKIAEKSELIETVQKLRAEKEEHYKNLSELRKELRKIRETTDIQGIDSKEIRIKEKELQKLELKQQTTQLNKTEELKVVSEIKRFSNEIRRLKKQRDTELQSNSVVRELSEKINEERQKGEGLKKEIEEISNKISAISDDINTRLQELDEVRKNADTFHEQFIKFSQESEKEHEAFIKAKNDLRDLEKVISSLRTKNKTTKKKEKEGELQKKATTLFDKFKKGEQLTTEDLLILQKAGFL